MEQLSVWVGAGVVTAGMSAALLVGTGTATAETGSGTGPGTGSSSESSASSSAKSSDSDAPEARVKPKPPSAHESTPKSGPSARSKPKPKPTTDVDEPSSQPAGSDGDGEKHRDPGRGKDAGKDAGNGTGTSADQAKTPDTSSESDPTSIPKDDLVSGSVSAKDDEPDAARPFSGTRMARPTRHGTTSSDPQATAAVASPADQKLSDEKSADDETVDTNLAVSSTTEPTVDPVIDTPAGFTAKSIVAQDVSANTLGKTMVNTKLEQASPLAAAAPVAPVLAGVVQGVLDAVVNVASLIFNTVQAVEALVTGPPQVPPGSTVTVQSSTIQLSNGQRVPANWYYPKGDAVPDRMILLQHGFFALGPMYSYTAATLAEQTQSIVVTPTLSSNPFAGDSFWLGGTGMAKTIADLFLGDRAALNQSAMDAGFATRYGPDTKLPDEFALAGHSLGANLVSGAAGFLADSCTADGCAADDLVGVILLDGVPVGTTLPDALQKLNDYTANGGHYIPVREIGAPLNLFNSTSTVNADLAKYRSGRYNGVVLDGGVHMDSMRGGNPLIQFVAYLVAGFPQPQNPPAVDQLSTTWLNHWFAGKTNFCADGFCEDDYVPGSTMDIATPQGFARGVVIGSPPAAKLLTGPVGIEPSTPTTIPRVTPTLARLAA